jgi:hypothetical protein
MLKMLLVIGAILALKIGMDVLFLAKIDAFNRTNRFYYLMVTFIETSFGIFGLKIVLDMVGDNYFYIFVYAAGAVLAGLISSLIKRRLDDKLEGQRKFFARITLDDSIDETDLIGHLKEHEFEMVVEKQQYISGRFRTVIQGSLENRSRMNELKDILRGRKGKHLVITRAEDIYYIP